MSLSQLGKAKRAARPALTIDLEPFVGEAGALRFREPAAADIFPRADVLKELRVAFPEFPEPMLMQVAVLGRCYIADEGDGSVSSPSRAFGQLARDNRDLFFHILSEFNAAFPTGDFDAAKDAAKNASSE